MSVTIRSKGHDVVVRAGGKRVRVTREWTSVSDYVFDRVSEVAGNLIEVRSRPIFVTTEAPAAEPTAPIAVDLGDSEPLDLPQSAPVVQPKQQSRKAKKAMRQQIDAREDAQQGE